MNDLRPPLIGIDPSRSPHSQRKGYISFKDISFFAQSSDPTQIDIQTEQILPFETLVRKLSSQIEHFDSPISAAQGTILVTLGVFRTIQAAINKQVSFLS